VASAYGHFAIPESKESEFILKGFKYTTVEEILKRGYTTV